MLHVDDVQIKQNTMRTMQKKEEGGSKANIWENGNGITAVGYASTAAAATIQMNAIQHGTKAIIVAFTISIQFEMGYQNKQTKKYKCETLIKSTKCSFEIRQHRNANNLNTAKIVNNSFFI